MPRTKRVFQITHEMKFGANVYLTYSESDALCVAANVMLDNVRDIYDPATRREILGCIQLGFDTEDVSHYEQALSLFNDWHSENEITERITIDPNDLQSDVVVSFHALQQARRRG